ncbi:helix-turn-helix domain-containing protein [Streptomyces sp. GXMU-J15]|uniref:Helix-turn-helix domain-containing protein n=1 Tax=Streptomyces fuscus TaxID=3048495 RepID=A0ABT7IX66_9ACTN|nr:MULTISPECIES: helix-turn-helix domain-containing protein [Streptomyces]MDL2076127.1 helix-turn-helix domain-containing protein [Streptomyces fuscus]SBT95874.1 PucR C-terminal helix-turn-helix domain-containing protein [Streptomyces sp. DI166]
MRTYAAATPEPDQLFPADGTMGNDDADDARRRVQWELFSALTEVVSGQGDWSTESAARIRGEGRAWARRGGSVDELLAMLRTMTRRLINHLTVGGQEQDFLKYEVTVLRLGDAGRRVGRELSCGFFEIAADDSACADTEPPRPEPPAADPAPTPDTCAVLGVRAPSCTRADIERAFRGHAVATVLGSPEGAHALLSAADQDEALALARAAHQDLPGEVWIAVHWQDSHAGRDGVRELPDDSGLSVVDGICTTLLALGSPPGVYELDDVLVEYGAAANPAVSERLVRMVEPLHEHPVLWDTLAALIAADGVRHRACLRLGIHRNTLDRRLQRIALLTGQRPDGLRGLATLRAALAVVAVTRLQHTARLAGHTPPPARPHPPHLELPTPHPTFTPLPRIAAAAF